MNKYKIEDFFVSYEIAKWLKDLGFDYPCLGWWDDSFSINELMIERINPSQSVNLLILAPTYDQVFTWFREKHEIHGWIHPNSNGMLNDSYCWSVWYKNNNTDYIKGYSPSILHIISSKQAQEECIKQMITIIKNET